MHPPLPNPKSIINPTVPMHYKSITYFTSLSTPSNV